MKVVLITGCSSGFGRLTAELLAENGFLVYAGLRRREELDRFANKKNLIPVQLDVTWASSKIAKVIELIIARTGKIDVLINNAGFGFIGPVGDFFEEEIRDQFETNFFGQFKVISAALPLLRREKRGLIININTISGLISTAFYGVYSASKFALDACTTALRFEEAVNGISVVSVYPGSFKTNFWENLKWAKKSPEINKKIAEIANAGRWRLGNPIQVANKFSWLGCLFDIFCF